MRSPPSSNGDNSRPAKRRKMAEPEGRISVSARIPNFQSATGLFNKLKKQHKLKFLGKDLFDASVY
ncbi:hypothetical protein BKA58DRAFT_439476 [Alternaria rosae]|uniref:uncharacterized protein n=1 Tax=Alternaria rosae TaxID=1187941 RepID=UPI001E8D073C|nr:uncharacterized protein BKA58DRAFT_439476 [Alternaria rosae]KAH6869910.1 hypothetical protein BKA58DRAFT_439476 [Alternaria rosae]